MNRPMKLKGIIQKDDGVLIFHGSLHDNSPFSIQVDENNIELNQPFTKDKNRVEGWLFIQQEGQQGTRVYITLPSPSLQHGHHVLVHEFQLMPLGATLADFGAKNNKPVGVKIPAPKKD